MPHDETHPPTGWAGPRRDLSFEHEHIYSVLEKIDRLQALPPQDIDVALKELNCTSVASVPGAQFASITVVEESGAISTVGATDPCAARLDDIQAAVGEGPCLSAAWSHDAICIDDLTAESRWPRFRESAISSTPVRSSLSVRLFHRGKGLAALNFHAMPAGVFTDESVEIGLLFAAHTTLAWNVMRREEQFRSALASRDVIGQAKGMVMERFNIDAYSAFELLRRLSQSSNIKLVEVAEKLVASERPSSDKPAR